MTSRTRQGIALVVALLSLSVVAVVPARADSATPHALGPGTSWAATRVDLPVGGIAYDAQRGRLLASVSASDPSLGNELVELDPVTGALGRHVLVGSDPTVIALSDDGTTAYVALRSAGMVTQVDLTTFTVSRTIRLPYSTFYGFFGVEDMAVQPGHADVLVASLTRPDVSPRHAGVFVFRDGVQLADHTAEHTGANRIEFTGPSTITGINNETSGFEMYTIAISSTGANATRAVPDSGSGYYADIEQSGGVVFTTAGKAIAPAGPTLVASYAASGPLEVLPGIGAVSYLDGGELRTFHLSSGALLDARSLNGIDGTPRALVATAGAFAALTDLGLFLTGPDVGASALAKPAGTPSSLQDMAPVASPVGVVGAAFDRTRNQLYASFSTSASDSVAQNRIDALDPTTGAVVRTLALPVQPGLLALSDDASQLYVSLLDSVIARISTSDLQVTELLDLANADPPPSLSNRRVVALSVVPGRADTVLATVTSGCCGASTLVSFRGSAIHSIGQGGGSLAVVDRHTAYTTDGSSAYNAYRIAIGDDGSLSAPALGDTLVAYPWRVQAGGGRLFVQRGTRLMAVDVGGPTWVGSYDLPQSSAAAIDVAGSRVWALGEGHLRETDLLTGRTVGEVAISAPGGTVQSLVRTSVGFAALVQGTDSAPARLWLVRPVPRPSFVQVGPARLLDTRPTSPVGPLSGSPAAGKVLHVPIPDDELMGVDAGTAAVALTVTATQPSGPGFLTVWPCGAVRPTASNLNVSEAGQTVANLVLAAPGTSREVCIYTSSPMHVVVDLDGVLPKGNGYTPTTPLRLLDSRTGAPGLAAPGSVVRVQVTGRAGVPSDAAAVALNVTATGSLGAGWVTVWPCGTAKPLASNLNLERADQTVANLVVVGLGAGGEVCISPSVGTHLIADVSGWWSSGLVPSGPTRLLDTRAGSGQLGYTGGRPTAGQTVELQVGGRAGLPTTGADGVVLNLTITGAQGPGFVTVWPCGSTRPTASSLNAARSGQTVAAAVATGIGVGGKVCIYTSGGGHLIADLAGWFARGAT